MSCSAPPLAAARLVALGCEGAPVLRDDGGVVGHGGGPRGCPGGGVQHAGAGVVVDPGGVARRAVGQDGSVVEL